MNKVATIDRAELRDLYRELILDHARKPRHFGKLAGATHSVDGINPLCGDKLHLYLTLDNDVIADAAFEGSGCAISLASASLMTDMIIGRSLTEANDWYEHVTARLTGKPGVDGIELGKLAALEGVRDFPSRVKCATLAWHALHAATDGRAAPVTTE